MAAAVDERRAKTWVEGYVAAWRSGDPNDLDLIFSKDAESHETPYATQWIGLPAIKTGWADRSHWQEGGWNFEWEILYSTGNTFAVGGTGTYKELGEFENLWVVTLDDDGLCTEFRMWNNEKPADG